MQSGKLFDSWSHSKFISNQKYNFSREEILKVLPKSFIDDAYTHQYQIGKDINLLHLLI